MRLTLAWLASVLLVTPAFAAQPTDPTATAIFAGGNLTFNGFNTVIGGPIVANGNVLHNGGTLNFASLYAGGSFSDTPASYQNSTGDILFGGNITNLGGPGSTFGGNITSGGSIAFLNSSQQVAGNVTAALNVSLPFSFAAIHGNVLAGGDVNIQGDVGGNVTYGNNFTLGTFGSVSGITAQGGPVTPTPFVPLTLPAGSNLTPGLTNVTLASFEDRSLAPGAYGALTMTVGNTLSLSAGQYVFSSFTSGSVLNHLSFDTSAGPISIYVKEDFDFDLIQDINGVSLFAGGTPNPDDSHDIFFETGANFIGGSSFFGTVFAPNGNVTLETFTQATGRILAGHDVIINSGGVTLVPEPASLGVLACAGILLARRRRRATAA